MNKNLIREDIKQKKSELSEAYIEVESQKIINRLLDHSSYQNAKYVFTYVAFNQEVRTKEFIKQAILDGKKVAVPKIMNNTLEFIWVTEGSTYELSTMGIDEPDKEVLVTKEDLLKEDMILNIVPGLAFDHKRNRVGYGKGFYDRYFEENKGIDFRKVAITYDFQIIDHIDCSEFDIKVDEIISQTHHII